MYIYVYAYALIIIYARLLRSSHVLTCVPNLAGRRRPFNKTYGKSKEVPSARRGGCQSPGIRGPLISRAPRDPEGSTGPTCDERPGKRNARGFRLCNNAHHVATVHVIHTHHTHVYVIRCVRVIYLHMHDTRARVRLPESESINVRETSSGSACVCRRKK